MKVEVGNNYLLEEFRLEPEKRRLVRSGVQVRLANLPFLVLLYLIENRDRVVARDELLENFWDGCDVYDTAVTKCVGAIRKALNDTTDHPRFIETRWAEGYRFIGDVKEELGRETSTNGQYEPESPLISNGDGLGKIDNVSSFRSLKVWPLAAPKRFIGITAVIAVCAVFALAGLIFLQNSLTHDGVRQPLPTNSIAVLPFKDLSNNSEQEIYADGMTESLIGALSKIQALKVISFNSVLAFKGKDADPREVARQLDVANILEGSVRENGNKLSVEVRLVNGETGQIVWSGDDYERPLGNTFENQSDIARSVAAGLRLKLSKRDEQDLTRRSTESVEAYQAYVKGRYFWKKKTPEGLSRSRELFEEAIRLDPNYAQAYAGLADYYLTGIWYANFSPQEAIGKAKPAILRSLELDNTLADAHIVVARIAEMEWDWENYRKETEKALELDPNNAHGWQGYAFYLENIAGHTDEAVTAIKRAAELDPLSVSVNVNVGAMLTHAGRTDEAIADFQKILEIDPQFSDAYENLGNAYLHAGKTSEAISAYIESERLAGADQQRLAAFRLAASQKGIKGLWQARLEFLHEDAKKKFLPQFWFAVYYARLGENDAAFECLEKAYQAHEPLLVNLNSDHALEPLRSDPRFADLRRRVGLAN